MKSNSCLQLPLNRLILLIIFTLWAFPIKSFPQQLGWIRGKVKNSGDQSPLVGVNIVVKNTFWGTTTRPDGSYEIKLPAGRYVLRFSMIGYTVQEHAVEVLPEKSIELSIALDLEPIAFSGVVVESERVEKSPASRVYVIKAFDARNVPPLGEPDILNTLKTLPGVIQNNDLRGELHIRGGGADQNLILLDGVEIHNPYHLFGIFGTFNIDALEGAELFIGNFPVRYGGKISSVMDIKTKNPQNAFTANLSLLSSSLAWNKNWQSTSVLFSLRRTHLDLMVPVHYHFTDSHLKVSHTVKGIQFTLSGFANEDRLTGPLFEEEEDEEVAATWGNRMVAFNISWIKNPHLLTGLVSLSTNKARLSTVNNHIDDTHFRFEYEYVSPFHTITLGIQTKHLQIHYDWDDSENLGNDIKEIFSPSSPMIFQIDFENVVKSMYLGDKITLGQ